MSWRARISPNISNLMSFINPKDPNCFGVRSWWRKNLPELQLLNPYTALSVQELTFGEPIMFVVYSNVDHRIIRLAGATEEEVEDIIHAVVTWGENHARAERGRCDDGGDPLVDNWMINFQYTDSFIAKSEIMPPWDASNRQTEGSDDPGQHVRVWPRNTAKFNL